MWRIKDWNNHYENAKSEVVQAARWVPVPNKQDGDGYLTLLDHKDGAAHYGCFMAIVLLASKCGAHGARGNLRQSNGIPHTVETISRKTHMPPALVLATLNRCRGVEVGWVEWVDDSEAGGDLFAPASRGASDRTVAASGKVESDGGGDGEMPRREPVKSLKRTSEVLSGDSPSAGRMGTGSGKGIPAAQGGAEAGKPPAAPAATAAALAFECVGGRKNGDRAWTLTAVYTAELAKAFPGVDIGQQAVSAHVKYHAAPVANRKTADRMPEYLWNWMKNEQNGASRRSAGAGGGGGGGGATNTGVRETVEQRAARIGKQLEGAGT